MSWAGMEFALSNYTLQRADGRLMIARRLQEECQPRHDAGDDEDRYTHSAPLKQPQRRDSDVRFGIL